jgi:alpha-tubulin suppressor-like RCC1 family protein
MPKDDINYKFTENGIVYDFYDVFVPAENFRQPTLFTWGLNSSGQLGTNNVTTRSTPVTTFAGGTTWKSLCQSGDRPDHIAAIKTDGSLWIWGNNDRGHLGNNTLAYRSTPVTTFAGGNNWKQVACSGYNTAAIKTDGTLWVWGSNIAAQLGINSGVNFNQQTPVTTFAGGNNWKSVACGRTHTAAIKTDGSLWVWGSNTDGRLGINATTNRSTPITTFAGGTNWKSVACGENYISAIKTDGTLWTWGGNANGQLGINNTANRSTPVTTFAGGTNWKSVDCGRVHTAAIKTDGTIWNWGLNSDGQLGTGDGTQRNTPVIPNPGGTNWKSAFAGNAHVAATKTDGTLWVWGGNGSGQLGINIGGGNRLSAVTTFAGGNNWKSVIAGGSHTAAIKYQPDP